MRAELERWMRAVESGDREAMESAEREAMRCQDAVVLKRLGVLRRWYAERAALARTLDGL